MADDTKIEWATSTGGPYLGCSPVSPGCVNCYAWALALLRLAHIFRKAFKAAGFPDWETRPVWGNKATRVLSKGFWNDAVRMNAKHAKAGTRGRWFPSMIDWLDEMPGGIIDQEGNKLEPVEVLARFLKLIHDTPNLDWLLLTKRPENFFTRTRAAIACARGLKEVGQDERDSFWTPDNVWIGASVEDQQRADERIPELLKIPAKVRFLSVEPLLGPVGLFSRTNRRGIGETGASYGPGPIDLHWVIVGGESGPGARPCHVQWVRSVVRQCKAAGVPCFVKQLGSDARDGTMCCHGCSHGGPHPLALHHKKGGDPSEWPEDLRVREFPTMR